MWPKHVIHNHLCAFFCFGPFQRQTSFTPLFPSSGEPFCGQTTHLAPALLRELEKYPVYTLDLPSMYSGASLRSPEEAVVQIVMEARRRAPSVLYMPQLDRWFGAVSSAMRDSLDALLMVRGGGGGRREGERERKRGEARRPSSDVTLSLFLSLSRFLLMMFSPTPQAMPADTRVLMIATTEAPYVSLPLQLQAMFTTTFEVAPPTLEETRQLVGRWCEFVRMAPLQLAIAAVPVAEEEEPVTRRQTRGARVVSELPARTLNDDEKVGLEALEAILIQVGRGSIWACWRSLKLALFLLAGGS
jgi:SpoVK/Ycf46/Vps4 family AAA+-type ATPase